MNKLQVLMAALLLLLVATSSYAADTVRQITLPTKDLIYDAGTQTIYASVPSRACIGGNSITPIDPVAGTSGTPVFVGSEPGKMAISDNGQYIYVALDGAAAVRRYNVAAKTAELQFSLGNDNGPNYVEDLAVMPGSPHTLAVSEMSLTATPHHVRVAIFDDGTLRPKTAVGANVIEFGNTPARLYGYANEANDDNIFNFTRWNVDSTGIAGGDTVANLIAGAGVDIKYDNGRIYATNGTVINAEARTLAGTLPAGLVEPDATVNRVFVLTGSGSTLTLHAFDPATFLEVGSLDITGVNGTPGSLIRWGFNGLAFRTSGDQVFLIQTGLIADVVAPTAAFTFPANGTT
ncbi:MAG: hypothetical protein JOZ57_13800, partial [Abitibacteriaceae bacterium]|nr:hypothetical protein [Abditibacteriaceae bacterium]